ncbi:MAG TPA: outer membrane lipoprotein carrier protein LolA [Chthoniobacterales bacterium]|jgi:chaperone LolA|nr:outer membrane lipoprotein carrier protein LolA [Chthoniobacterales bacterium]
MIRKLSPLLFALTFVGLNADAQQLAEADIKNLLARIGERRASAPDVHADFQEQRTMRLMTKPIASSGKIWFHAPNKFRREVTGNSPSVTVSNGRDLWIYYPNFKSAEHYTLGQRSPVDAAIAAINTALNLENVEKTFHISGRKIDNAYALELLPRSPSMKRMFQKFDLRLNGDLIAERTEMTQPNGDRVVTIYSNQTRAAIPAATFEFTPPPGTQTTSPLGR